MTEITVQPVRGTGALAAALAKAQADFGTVTKSKTVTVQKRTGGTYQFAYAPLDTILEATRKPLADNGLVVVQVIDDGHLVTTLLHESGENIGGGIALPSSDDIQAFGSAITYLRRYAIQALLGIAAEDDDDGNRAAGNEAHETTHAGGESLELLGNLAKSGTLIKGTGTQYKGEWRDGPAGHSIGLRLKLDGEDRDIPQVLITGSIGEALYLAHPDIVGVKVSVRGKLYSVRQTGRQTYYRLVIGEHPDADFIETPDFRIPALASEPVEAESIPMQLDPEERLMVGGGLPD